MRPFRAIPAFCASFLVSAILDGGGVPFRVSFVVGALAGLVAGFFFSEKEESR